MKIVGYMTHPLGEIDFAKRADNVANAMDWVLWMVENTPWAINAAWLVNLVAADGELHRPRALMDQMAQLLRCDALILVGGLISPHMRVEYEFAKKRDIPIVDATILGRRPPERGSRPPGVRNDWASWMMSIATRPILPLVAR